MPAEQNQVFEMTGGQAATLAGITYRRFSQLFDTDHPPPRGEDGKYRSDTMGIWLAEHTRRKVLGNPKNVDALDPVRERARKDREMADRYELENRVRRGELIESSTVMVAAMEVVMRVKSRMLRLPAVLAPLVLGEEDRVTIQSTLDEGIRDALTELSGEWTGDNSE